MENLTREGAEAIYRERYWLKVRGDALPPPLALVLFEFAVNPGATAAIKALQRAVGVRVDGIFGPRTLHAALVDQQPELYGDVLRARGDYYAEQVARYPYKRKWLDGWLARNYRLAIEVGRWLEREAS